MKIYILRHEDRTQDATMFSPLTEKGLSNALKLSKELNKLNINVIYSSPFVRTLQTIYPYSSGSNTKVNLEYSIAEMQHQKLIPEKSYQVRLPKYLAEMFNYNPNYNSMIYPEDFKYPEEDKDVQSRIRKFLLKIFNNHSETNDTILIVTHQAVCNSILKIIAKKGDTCLDKHTLPSYSYPTGGVTKVFDKNCWKFKPVNWEYEK